MRKNIKAMIFYQVMVYLFSIASVIFVQINLKKESVLNNNFIGMSALFNCILISLFYLKYHSLVNFIGIKEKRQLQVTLVCKYLYFLLICVFLINAIEMKTSFIVVLTLATVLFFVDIVLFVKSSFEITNSVKEKDIDIHEENKIYYRKMWDKSKDFRIIQVNIFNILLSLVSVYIASFFTDFNNAKEMIIFVILITITLLFAIRYCVVLSRFACIKWYEIFGMFLFYTSILILLYYEMNFFVLFGMIPVIPIVLKEEKIRKEVISKNKGEDN